MKSIFIKTSASLFAFLIGLAAFQYSDVLPENEFRAENLEIIEPTAEQLSSCQLMDEPHRFDGKLVSFQATAYITYDINYDEKIILYPNEWSCRAGKFTYVYMELDSYNGNYSNLKSLLEGEDLKSLDGKEVDVQVIGTAQPTYEDDGSLYYSFSPEDIKIISSFRKFESKGGA